MTLRDKIAEDLTKFIEKWTGYEIAYTCRPENSNMIKFGFSYFREIEFIISFDMYYDDIIPYIFEKFKKYMWENELYHGHIVQPKEPNKKKHTKKGNN